MCLSCRIPLKRNELMPLGVRSGGGIAHAASISNIGIPAVKESQSRGARARLPSVSVPSEITWKKERIRVAQGRREKQTRGKE